MVLTIQINSYFDTLKIKADKDRIKPLAEKAEINFRYFEDGTIGISLDETTTQKDVLDIAYVFAQLKGMPNIASRFDAEEYVLSNIPVICAREHLTYLTHPVFNIHHSESQMMRYLKQLENKDLSLNHSMISLGSCTMKLNAATEMIPVSWPAFSHLHPFVPAEQAQGYQMMIDELSRFLCEITGFDACSLQPNSGAQGEYAGLLTIMQYHKAQGNGHRNVVLIPISAHGTNPASAVMTGMKVVVVKSDAEGHIDVADLKAKAEQYKDTFGCPDGDLSVYAWCF